MTAEDALHLPGAQTVEADHIHLAPAGGRLDRHLEVGHVPDTVLMNQDKGPGRILKNGSLPQRHRQDQVMVQGDVRVVASLLCHRLRRQQHMARRGPDRSVQLGAEHPYRERTVPLSVIKGSKQEPVHASRESDTLMAYFKE